jgi:glycosyltransferase involved in cell wall biosynthesis
MDVSIIIAVYNSEKYIKHALDSALEQEFTGELEIIIINDGSSDNCGRICEDYATNFSHRLVYLEHKENKGVSVARNKGMDIMTGRYFIFLDSDDILPVNSIQMMYDLAEKKQSDIVIGSIKKGKGDLKLEESSHSNKIITLHGDHSLIELLNHDLIRGYAWGKLFKNKGIQNAKFSSDLSYAEDLLFCVETFSNSGSICITDIFCYYYRQHAESTVANKYANSLYVDWLKSIDLVGDNFDILKLQKSYCRLKVKTIHQLVRELRYVKKDEAAPAIVCVREKMIAWQISLSGLLRHRSFNYSNILKVFQINHILWKLSMKYDL